MGHLGAQAFAEQVDEGNASLRQALSWHLTANHYPPLPYVYVDVAEQVIDKVREAQAEGYGVWDADVVNERIVLPADIEPEPRAAERDEDTGELTCRIGDLIEILHLSAFLHDDEGDFS